jgi:hypothetical protein
VSRAAENTAHESLLVAVLRVVGAVSLLALVFVPVPHAWMDVIHRWLGMGVLPDQPIVSYLARSTSFFYALMGGLMWLVSGDVRRHRAVIVYLGAALTALGLVLGIVDWTARMPSFWLWIEAPSDILIGLLLLALGSGVADPSCLGNGGGSRQGPLQ